MARSTGRFEPIQVGDERATAFVPRALPPRDPPLLVDETTRERLAQARAAVERLTLVLEVLPGAGVADVLTRREAVASCNLAGVEASLVDVLRFDATGRAEPEQRNAFGEVRNYLDALGYARGKLRRARSTAPSSRLLGEAHRRLMRGARGAAQHAGKVRENQNWIGGTGLADADYVPPPPSAVPELLAELDAYLKAAPEQPALVRAALVHAQFESIHPYVYGNGRMGRLLLLLLFEHWDLLSAPVLGLSAELARRVDDYFRHLNAVRTDGDWEAWIRFFLERVRDAADGSLATIRAVTALVAADRDRVLGARGSSVMAARLFEHLVRHPVVTVAQAAGLLRSTRPAATKAIAALVKAGVLKDMGGKSRERTYGYVKYLKRLERTLRLV